MAQGLKAGNSLQSISAGYVQVAPEFMVASGYNGIARIFTITD